MKRQREDLDSSAERAATDQNNNNNDDETAVQPSAKKQKRQCPYLDTVNRSVLDFDFEKICSVSLSPINVYGCLVCGKFFQGRSRTSHAVTHSLEADHHVFINLSNGKCYCLPDDYEIDDSALDDVKRYLEPDLSKQVISALDTNSIASRTLDGKQYHCGLLGLNNVNKHDHINVILQSLAHLSSFRDFWLDKNNYYTAAAKPASELVGRFGAFVRKLWNPHNFRNHISPQELLLEISRRSEKRFRVGLHGDPLDFLSWLLNTLHRDLISVVSVTQELEMQAKASTAGGQAVTAVKKQQKKSDQSAITANFQGKVKIVSEKPAPKQASANPSAESDSEEEDPNLKENSDDDDETAAAKARARRTKAQLKAKRAAAARAAKMDEDEKFVYNTTETPFFFLSLDLPSVVLIKDELQRNVIQQVSLFELLTKFDGKTKQFVATTRENRTYSITQLPKYLIVHFKRFTKNQWFAEKNKTIVNFPLKNLDLKDYVTLPPGVKAPRYNLVANLRHDGGVDAGSYSVHLLHKAVDKWYNVQDLIVEETEPHPIAISEAYIQFYERCDE